MIKAESKNGMAKVSIEGDLTEICVDTSQIVRAIAEGLNTKNPIGALTFKMMFIKGMMDGMVFDESRETIEEWLRIIDEAPTDIDEVN